MKSRSARTSSARAGDVRRPDRQRHLGEQAGGQRHLRLGRPRRDVRLERGPVGHERIGEDALAGRLVPATGHRVVPHPDGPRGVHVRHRAVDARRPERDARHAAAVEDEVVHRRRARSRSPPAAHRRPGACCRRGSAPPRAARRSRGRSARARRRTCCSERARCRRTRPAKPAKNRTSSRSPRGSQNGCTIWNATAPASRAIRPRANAPSCVIQPTPTCDGVPAASTADVNARATGSNCSTLERVELAVGAGRVDAVRACGDVAGDQFAGRARVHAAGRAVALPRDDERRPHPAQVAIPPLRGCHAAAAPRPRRGTVAAGRSGSEAPAARSAAHIVTWFAESTGTP